MKVPTVLETREKSGEMKNGGNGQEKYREFEKERGKSGKSQGISTVCPNVPLLKFYLMISVSTKMVSQEAIENFLRSGISQEKSRKMKFEKSGHPDYGKMLYQFGLIINHGSVRFCSFLSPSLTVSVIVYTNTYAISGLPRNLRDHTRCPVIKSRRNLWQIGALLRYFTPSDFSVILQCDVIVNWSITCTFWAVKVRP